MRARHNVLNVVAEVPDNDYYRDKGWAKVSDDTPTTVEAKLQEEGDRFLGVVVYDPSAHSVEDVQAYLADAPEAEVTRVLQAERDGKARKTILGDEG
jgi:trigger factor